MTAVKPEKLYQLNDVDRSLLFDGILWWLIDFILLKEYIWPR